MKKNRTVVADGVSLCRCLSGSEGDLCVDDQSENRQDVFGDSFGDGVRVRRWCPSLWLKVCEASVVGQGQSTAIRDADDGSCRQASCRFGW